MLASKDQISKHRQASWSTSLLYDIYLNAKVSQHLLKCSFLLSDPNISIGDNVIAKSRDLPFIQY